MTHETLNKIGVVISVAGVAVGTVGILTHTVPIFSTGVIIYFLWRLSVYSSGIKIFAHDHITYEDENVI